MKKNLLSIVATTLLLTSGSLMAKPYVLDISHSNVGFKVKHMIVSTVTGKFGEFSGNFDVENGVFKSLEGVINAESIDTGIEKRDNHLRSDDFLNAEMFEEITFVMTSATKDKMTGDLTIRDVTKSVTLDLDFGGVVMDPWGGERVGFTLEGKISRKAFGLKWNDLLETGGAVVGDEIRLVVEIEGIAQ